MEQSRINLVALNPSRYHRVGPWSSWRSRPGRPSDQSRWADQTSVPVPGRHAASPTTPASSASRQRYRVGPDALILPQQGCDPGAAVTTPVTMVVVPDASQSSTSRKAGALGLQPRTPEGGC
jgi:hypothetical protein